MLFQFVRYASGHDDAPDDAADAVNVPEGYKRCKCRDGGRELGAGCPRLRRSNHSWNPRHGSWYGKSDVPVPLGEKRATLRAGGFEGQEDMRAWFRSAIELLDIPEDGPGGYAARIEILGLIHAARREGAALPAAADIRLRYATGATFEPGTTGEYLTNWLARHEKAGDWTASTLHEYKRITRVRLVPALGAIPLAKLTTDDVWRMFEAIDTENDRILGARASGDPAVRKSVAGRRVTGITTKRRNLAVLRSALGEASSSAPGRPRLLSVNVTAGMQFGRDRGKAKGARAKARLWTTAREAAWRKGYRTRAGAEGVDAVGRYLAYKNAAARPSNVMIWKPEHLGRFLDAVEVEGDRLYAMFCVIAYAGLRRGEACGLRWDDVDEDSGSVMIGPTIVQVGWKAVEQEHAKSEASDDWVRLEQIVMRALREWRKTQLEERMAWGEAWNDTGYVFTERDGRPYHPGHVTERFYRLSHGIGLPPIRLHDLRHGAATLALAAGKSMKEVSAMLRHSSESITSDIYASVLPELQAEVSAAVVAMVPRKNASGK